MSRRPDDSQLDRELRFHIQRLVDEKIAAGIAPEEARRQALLEFGGQQQIKEELRDVYRLRFVESSMRNLRSACRFMRAAPSFSITVMLTLALGIGANSAVFSAIHAILLRPLPFPNADQLVVLAQYNPKGRNPMTPVAPVRVEDWNRMNSTFQAITGYYTEDVSETSGQLPEKITRAWVSPRFFQVWGVAPAIGRTFAPNEERFHGTNAVVISDRFWRRRFGGTLEAIGRRLRLDGYPYTIIGIMPPSFLFPERDVDLFIPSPVDFPLSQTNRELTWYTCVGRMRPGVGIAQARADLATVQGQLGQEFPKTDKDLAIRIAPQKEIQIGGIRRSLWILFGSVSLLLVLACCNIASLLLARTAQRAHEIAIRFSLGASRGSVILQLLTETFVLALGGSVLGVLVAAGAANAFHALAKNLPRGDEVRLDWTIVVYTLGCSVIATLLCGLLPAFRATRRSLSGAMSQSSRRQVSARSPLQWALVSLQVALAVTLLAGAGLLLRTFQALGRISPGFDPSHVLTLRISGNYGETSDMKTLTARINRTLEELRGVPGVETAATSLGVPGAPSQFQAELKISGEPAESERKLPVIPRYVSDGYFAALRIPVLAGEACRDNTLSAQTAVVNQSFVNTYLAGGPVIGRRIEPVRPGLYAAPPAEIRGIVGDAREQGLDREPAPTVYRCFGAGNPTPVFLIRTYGEPMTMAESLRRKIHEIEPGRSVFEVMPLADHLSENFAENRMRAVLLTFFALSAVSLACMGLYGTLSYLAGLRRREIGLRLAIGALRGQIASQFLLEGLRASVLGCGAGLILAGFSTRLLAGMLYGVNALDTATFAGVAALILLTGTLSALLPAARAARVDPMQALREE